MKENINLGCGSDILPDYTNADFQKFEGVDFAIDLNKIPWGLSSDCFSNIKIINVLEHLKIMPNETLNELYRISKDGAVIDLEVPYCNSQSANSCDHIHRGFELNFIESLINSKVNQCDFKGEIVSKEFKTSSFGKLILPIPLRIGNCKNLRDIFAVLFNEVYTHIRVKIRVKKS